MNKKKLIVYGFGVIMLSMAVTQFLTFGYFNHILRDYLLPIGDGVEPLTFFVFPISLIIISMEGLCAIAILAMNRDNPFRETFIKLGIVVALVWFLCILSALIRGVPGFVGLFGEKLRQLRTWPILIEGSVLILWSFYAFKYSEDV